jgi:hypothetical protein
MHTTPVSLLERLRQPDRQAAWDRFVELYAPFLFCRRATKSRSTAMARFPPGPSGSKARG